MLTWISTWRKHHDRELPGASTLARQKPLYTIRKSETGNSSLDMTFDFARNKHAVPLFLIVCRYVGKSSVEKSQRTTEPVDVPSNEELMR
jgi:hypothetical protein